MASFTLVKNKSGHGCIVAAVTADGTVAPDGEFTPPIPANAEEDVLTARPDGVCVIDENYGVVHMKSSLAALFGRPEQQRCYELFFGRQEVCPWCNAARALGDDITIRKPYYANNGRTYEVSDVSPRGIPRGLRLCIFHDVTRQAVWGNIDGHAGPSVHRQLAQHSDYRAAGEHSLLETKEISNLLLYLMEEHKKRIARELHDDTLQTFALLSLRLDSVLQRDRGMSDETARTVKELRDLSRVAATNLRRTILELRPTSLDRGVVSALNSLVQDANQFSDVHVGLEIVGEEPPLGKDVETMFFRVAQEALNNVVKHSGAGEAALRLEFSPDYIRMTVRDNGRGFKLPEPGGGPEAAGGIGLTEMNERAKLIGADFRVVSAPGQGTYVTVELPRG